MNEGAEAFHSGMRMKFTTEDTIADVISDITGRLGEKISVFYGVSVSVRYAVRRAQDLVKAAENANLCIYNRLSVRFDDNTLVSVYGTGKSVYIVSLPELVKGLKGEGIYAKYCTANMQYEKDGKRTLRVSVVISKDTDTLNKFMKTYNDCVDKSISIQGIEKGEWKDLEKLLLCKK